MSSEPQSPPICPLCAGESARARFEVSGYRLWRCDDCESGWLSPPPSDEALNAIYGEAYYHAWGLDDPARAQSVRSLKRATFAPLVEMAVSRLGRGLRVLDVGCATGYLLEEAEAAGLQPFGVELSDYGATSCAARFGQGAVFCGELAQARFADNPDNRFSVIFMTDLIEHVRDPLELLRTARARLEPGGLLIITTPRFDSLSARLLGRYWPHLKAEHLYYLSAAALAHLLARAGFACESLAPAYKALDADYLHHHFSAYPSGVLSRALLLLIALLPPVLRRYKLKLAFGEMAVVARAQ